MNDSVFNAAWLDRLVADVRQRAAAVTFEPGAHRYTVAGLVKPSVTHLIDEIGFMDKRFMQDRTERGRYVHAQTLHVEDGILDLDAVAPEYRGYVESYAAWFDTVRPRVLLREQIVYDPFIDVVGTVDRLFFFDGWPEVCDFKAGVPQPWHHVQTAGYASLVCCNGFGNVMPRRSTLLLHKDGKPAKRIPHTEHDDYAAFTAAVSRHHWRARHVRP